MGRSLFFALFTVGCGTPAPSVGPLSATPALAQATPPAEEPPEAVPVCRQWEVANVWVNETFENPEASMWTDQDVGDLSGTRTRLLTLPEGWEPIGGADSSVILRRCLAR